MNYNRVFIRGDTHGDFSWLPAWCEENHTTTDDALIILGDACIMYYEQENIRQRMLKEFITYQPITLLCIRGNHEARPSNYSSTQFKVWEDDPIIPSGVYFEPDYPNILYIADGSTFSLNGKRCLAIGGAYSVDKEYRLLMKLRWFADEELTDEEMDDILDKIDHQSFDYVFTHTCPEDWQPTDLFLSGINQSKVSKRMEQFLTTVSEIIDFKHWYFGHFHDDRENINYNRTHDGQENVSMLFNKIVRVM